MCASLGLEVGEVFGFPVYGGVMTAACRWRPPPALVREAAGQPVQLACWVFGSQAEAIVPGGPRSAAVGPASRWRRPASVGVVLPVPAEPGGYHLAIDAVVEHQFWASWRGLRPYPLEAERLASGDVIVTDPATARRFVLRASESFQVPHRRYGVQCNERAVEIPWAVSQLGQALRCGGRSVLDVGYAYAEPAYEQALRQLGVPLLVGIDLVGRPKPHLRPYVADVRWPALRPGSLDAVLAISVLEHIGRDNACYPTPYADPSSTEGDQQAIRALAAALRPGGRLILSVPYGLAEDHGWFVQFDRARLERLLATSGLALGCLEHFRYHDGWQGPVDPAGLKGVRYGVGSVAAGAVACAVLVRGAA